MKTKILSPWELKTMIKIIEGMNQKEAAVALGTTYNCIHAYTVRAKKKLGAKTLAHAAVLFSEQSHAGVY